MMLQNFKQVLLLLLVFFITVDVSGQDPQFTQFFANPVYLSPSYAGASLGQRFVLSYRDQWSMVPNMFRTISASYDVDIASLRSGLGLFVLGDLAGTGRLGTILGGISYSYSLPMTYEWSFRPGISFYFMQKSIMYNRLIWGDQLNSNPIANTTIQILGKPTVYDIDVSTSVLFHNSKSWIGVTWDHMLRPKNSFYTDASRTPFRFTIFGGYKFVLRNLYRRLTDQTITLASNVRWQGNFGQLDIGGYWFRSPLIFGIWYRGIPLVKSYFSSDALAFMLGLRFSGFQVAYTYDLTISRFEPGSGGSHEISFTYESQIYKRKRRFVGTSCPPY